MASHHILILPEAEEEIWIPFDEAMALNPVMAISLPTMMITIQEATDPNPTRQMKAEDINNLSAMGSKSAPIVDVFCVRRARTPSAISESAAVANTANATNSCPLNRDKRRITKIGMQRIRKRVIYSGIFI